MNTIIIADRDAGFVKRLSQRIRDDYPNFSTIEIIGDGDLALKTVKTKKAGVAILNTDLEGTSGIEILKQVQAAHMETMVMLMSDTKNFDDAKSAIDYRAERFYLKPFPISQLLDALRVAQKNIEDRVRQAHDSAERYLMEWEWKRQNISLIYNGIFPFEITAKKGKHFWAERQLSECACFVVEFVVTDFETHLNTEFGGNEEAFYNAVIGLGEEENSKYAAYQVSSVHNRIIYIVLSDHKHRSQVEQFAQNLSNSLKSLYQISTEYILDEYSGIDEVVRFNEARRISNEYLQALSNDDTESAAEISEQISKIGDDKQVVAIIKTLTGILKEKYDICYNDIIKRVNLWADGVDHTMLLRELINRVTAELSSSRHLIVGIKDYISMNFANEISVESIAHALSMNASYLGRVFKEETGEKLVDYLFNARMQKAKELLASGKYTVKETAYSVGYNQIKYFGAIFKKHTGQTPSQYMKNHQMHSGEE